MQVSASFRPTLDRNHVGRYVAAVFGVVALICFYQPWVSGTLPAVGESTLTGLDLARGEASERVDRASFGPGAAGAGGVAAAPGGAAGAGAAVSSGGLTLPTRVSTVAPGAAGASSGSGVVGSAAPTVAAPAGASFGGLALPTRVPTVAAGAQSTAAASGAGSGGIGAARTPVPVGSTVEIGRQVTSAQPDQLPQVALYGVPLAAIGITVFSLVWDRLRDMRDRRYGKWWTIFLAFGGTLGVAYVLFKVSTAPAGNDLLAPGSVKAAQWGLWATFLAFLGCAASITAAWRGVRVAAAEHA